ncbi:type II toxin-antitoxin system HicB family antitoxin [Acidiferrimicrobium sp. IK]|uniref:type II toxin-antitoxin system HicB family antitoxin n=1 Tax=Acidiferrimicrobium sp. IK TaxID=2871700 RepID=UPI0021CB4DAC|nr:type II toxin-antitoxin system HicB family antitoxin [Acidiferrimicrobium sp. IK]MCU4185535.1 type II toxin-antitoxin system HicB family antitoxin [Acidiferrimicrobium sp. IK]
MTATTTYTAVYQRDAHGMWLVELLEEPRVHTYGRTLAKARDNIRDAAALWFETEPDALPLVDDVRLPAKVRTSTAKAHQARLRATAAQEEAAAATKAAAVALVRDGQLSVRDAAEVLGLSHQRIQQLVLPAGDRRSTHR